MPELKTYTLCSLFWLASLLVANAQEFEIRGKVFDESNSPIEDAELVISGTNKVVRTDKLGNYDFKVRPGNYQIQAFSIGKN